MTQILVHNSRGDAVVFTADGRLIGPHRTVQASPDDPVTLRLLDDGRLVHCGRTPSPDDEPDPVPEDDGEQVLEEPAGNASTKEWVDYAVSQGYPHSDVVEMKRSEIQDLLTETDETTPAGGDQPDTATAPGGADDQSEEEN